jgi:hypothetical protein
VITIEVRHTGFCAAKGQECCVRTFRCSEEDVRSSNISQPRPGLECIFHTNDDGQRYATIFTIEGVCSIDIEHGGDGDTAEKAENGSPEGALLSPRARRR